MKSHDERRKRYGRGAAAAALAAALACGGGEQGSGAAVPGATSAETSAGARSQSIPVSMLSEGGTRALPPAQEFQLAQLGFDFGSDDAPIKVVEFSDYGCGYCRRFHTETFPTLMREFIEPGRVQWKYVTYVSGMFANGMVAAFAAECAGEQDLFTPVSRMLYERQPDWKGLGEPYPVFEALAEEAGADTAQFRACITEQRSRGRVRSGILTGARLGVRGTPAFMVNGVPAMGAQPLVWWDGLFSAIEEEIGAEPGGAGRRSSPEPGP